VAALAVPSLTVLDVGHGSCAILAEAGRIVVFDAGPKSGLLEFLLQHGINTIDLVLISHADRDHIEGLIAILATNSISIKMVRLNTDSLKGSDIWDDLAYELDLLQKQGRTNFSPALTEGDNGQFNSAEITLEIVAPSAYLATKGPSGKDYYNRRITTNSISAVIRILYKGMPVILLTGDMDLIGLEEIIRGGKALNAPIMVFPHHGGNAATDMTSFSQKLYDLVKPQQVLFSIGRGRYGTPMPEVIATARKLNANVRISCTQLSERCSASVPAQENTHISAIFASGRDDRHCCAGSITISLSSGGNEFPIWSEHQDFITSFAPSALCRR
jgi:beta-lactamase superfamily II metal-dependent hydrolase